MFQHFFNIFSEIFPSTTNVKTHIDYDKISNVHVLAASEMMSSIPLQQDVSEFFIQSFNYFLESVGINTTIICNENISCCECGKTEIKLSENTTQSALSLHITDCHSIQQCIKCFLTEDIRNDINCVVCNKKQSKRYFFTNESTPQILIINLKRFKLNDDGDLVKNIQTKLTES